MKLLSNFNQSVLKYFFIEIDKLLVEDGPNIGILPSQKYLNFKTYKDFTSLLHTLVFRSNISPSNMIKKRDYDNLTFQLGLKLMIRP